MNPPSKKKIDCEIRLWFQYKRIVRKDSLEYFGIPFGKCMPAYELRKLKTFFVLCSSIFLGIDFKINYALVSKTKRDSKKKKFFCSGLLKSSGRPCPS